MLHESGETSVHSQFNKMRARIEIICDFEGLKRLSEIPKSHPH
jgi:hypothetical protein